MGPEITKLESSMFEGVITRGVMILFFKTNKSIYIYSDLSKEQIEGMLKAESKGKYFIANIQKTAKFKKTEYKTIDEAILSIL